MHKIIFTSYNFSKKENYGTKIFLNAHWNLLLVARTLISIYPRGPQKLVPSWTAEAGKGNDTVSKKGNFWVV